MVEEWVLGFCFVEPGCSELEFERPVVERFELELRLVVLVVVVV